MNSRLLEVAFTSTAPSDWASFIERSVTRSPTRINHSTRDNIAFGFVVVRFLRSSNDGCTIESSYRLLRGRCRRDVGGTSDAQSLYSPFRTASSWWQPTNSNPQWDCIGWQFGSTDFFAPVVVAKQFILADRRQSNGLFSRDIHEQGISFGRIASP